MLYLNNSINIKNDILVTLEHLVLERLIKMGNKRKGLKTIGH
jgi:hypothetical protein